MIRTASAIILLCAMLAVGGCGGERAQAGADARAGLAAAAPHADPTGAAILEGVNARLPAVAGVNSADWPAPAMTPERIAENPAEYNRTAPPEPARGWLKVAGLVGAIGLPLLYAIGRVAPMVPGLGTAAGAVANVAWSLLAHRDLKATDRARDVVAGAAGNLLPMAQTGNAPPDVMAALKLLAVK